MKRRILSELILILLFVLTSASCSGRSPAPRVHLDSDWMWTATVEDSSSFKSLEKNQLNSLDSLLENRQGFIWLKYEFALPSELSRTDLSCYLGRITMADRTYLNGVFIGGEGHTSPDSLSEWNKSRLYTIPSVLLARDGMNTLLVQIRVDHEGSIVSNPFIGTREDARFAALTETFWNSTINLLIAAIMIIISGYHLLLYVKRPVERENLLFSLVNLCTALYLSNFFITELPGMNGSAISFLWFQKIVANGMTFLLVYMICSFIKVFLNRTENFVVWIFRILLMILPLVAVILAPDYGTLRDMRGWIQLFLLPPLLYIMYMATHSLIQKNREALALLWGLAPLAVTVLLDIVLHQGLKMYNLPYISGFGQQLVIVSLLFVLASRFAGARTEVEVLNMSLERKVTERTQQLSETNDKMMLANECLEEARDIAEKDMKMAAFVQQSFFTRKAPVVEGWDIAFVFQPMSGVSGDLYDFYTDKNELHGISLFDVSGHGIAAGLVTMLAKTIIYRQFNEGCKLPLSTVMSLIDRKLIEEKGAIENYLTGLILRISGNRIEYVNAGHPEMYYRNGKTGIVRPVLVAGKDIQGRMLGIEGLADGYTAIGFPMMDQDTLLLYTDCLPEARNASGEEFGNNRIKDIFSRSGDTFASDKLGAIQTAFRNFIGDVPLNDDLTIVVLQRTTEKKDTDNDFIVPEVDSL